MTGMRNYKNLSINIDKKIKNISMIIDKGDKILSMSIYKLKAAEKSVRISEKEKWDAVINCDKSYDGLFFYGVKTTGIFCRPSCKSKTPIRDNVLFFGNASSAIEAGFRSCKRCCPERAVFQPGYELVINAKKIMEADYNKQIDLDLIANRLGISANHFIRLFKLYHGLTPARYIIQVRVNAASELLTASDLNILEIAYETGFKSLSNFYKCFKEQTGHSPKEYRIIKTP
jgi:AraC family transcriptional regulator of adaptative response / methylphosphotriester-DNA alkyltransferase methyltransferase